MSEQVIINGKPLLVRHSPRILDSFIERVLLHPTVPLNLPPAPTSRAAMHPVERAFEARLDLDIGVHVDDAFPSLFNIYRVYSAYHAFAWNDEVFYYFVEHVAKLEECGTPIRRAESRALLYARARTTEPIVSPVCANCTAFRMVRNNRGTCRTFERIVPADFANCSEYKKRSVA